jgi:hypothetical protein
MASEKTYDLFANRLASWTATPLLYENEATQHVLEAAPAAFVFVEMYGDMLDQETMGAPGANMWVEVGQTWLHVLTKSGTGSRAARAHASALLNLFREQEVGGLIMTEMSIGAGEPGQNFPNYWAMTATISWSRRDITGT